MNLSDHIYQGTKRDRRRGAGRRERHLGIAVGGHFLSFSDIHRVQWGLSCR